LTYSSAFSVPWTVWTYTQSKVCYRSTDGASNAQTIQTSNNFNIDKIGPTTPTLISPASWYVTTTTPLLSWSAVSDQWCSSISGYTIEVHSNSSCSAVVQSWSTASTSYTFDLGNNTTYYWRVRWLDVLWNAWSWSECRTVKVDATAPTSNIISINGWAVATNNAATTLTLSSSDPSGVTQMQFSCDNSTWTTEEAYATSKNFNITNQW
jgi:hypothetical protein